MDNNRISVALCTHNGQKYIAEQLASLAAQTRLPDELIICDDNSTDQTIAICEEFALKVPFKVHIERNNPPLRVTKNFEKALTLCTGDIIFLCDQDDYWLPEKIATLSEFLIKTPPCELVFSNAQLVTEQLQPIPRTQWDVVRFDDQQQALWQAGHAMQVMLGGNRITGCTVALRPSLLQVAVPFPTHIPELIHDNWLAWVATTRNSCFFLPKTLTYYRQHEAQQVGSQARINPPKVGWKQRFQRPRHEKLAPLVKEWEEWQALAKVLEATQPLPATWTQLQQKVNFLSMRSRLPANRLGRIFPATKHLLAGNYHRFKDQEANSKAPWLAFVGDLIE